MCATCFYLFTFFGCGHPIYYYNNMTDCPIMREKKYRTERKRVRLIVFSYYTLCRPIHIGFCCVNNGYSVPKSKPGHFYVCLPLSLLLLCRVFSMCQITVYRIIHKKKIETSPFFRSYLYTPMCYVEYFFLAVCLYSYIIFIYLYVARCWPGPISGLQ